MKFSGREWRAEERVRLLRGRGLGELGKVAFSFATQPFVEKQKREISGKRHRPKPAPWENS